MNLSSLSVRSIYTVWTPTLLPFVGATKRSPGAFVFVCRELWTFFGWSEDGRGWCKKGSHKLSKKWRCHRTPLRGSFVLVFRINYNKHDGFLEKLNRGERQQDRLFMLRWNELHLNRRKVSIFFKEVTPNYQKHFISCSFRPEIKQFGTGNSRQRPPFIPVPRQEISS